MQTYNHSHFYPCLGERFKFTELGHTATLKCVLQRRNLPCFFSSPSGGCLRCSLPLSCDCNNVNGEKVQFTHVNLLSEKDDMYRIQRRFYHTYSREWGDWENNYPYKTYRTEKEAKAEHRKLMREAGDCTDYRVIKVDFEF